MLGNASPLLATIHESNRQGRDGWKRFARHRNRVADILTSVAKSGSSLCILGAGNLNDVDFHRVLEDYRDVHLVDIDEHAVRSGLARHGLTESRTVRVHDSLDLTGILDSLPVTPEEAQRAETSADRLLDLLADHRCEVLGQPFDVTVSSGALTQLLQSVVGSSLSPADRTQVSLALRDKHLADLLQLTRPGGSAVLITDVVSTTTAPRLLHAAEADLEEQMAEVVAARNFFTGVNPYRIVALLEEDDRFRDLVAEVRLLDPWLWAVTRDRQHLTCGIVARRSLVLAV